MMQRSNSHDVQHHMWNVTNLCLDSMDILNPINEPRHAILTQTASISDPGRETAVHAAHARRGKNAATAKTAVRPRGERHGRWCGPQHGSSLEFCGSRDKAVAPNFECNVCFAVLKLRKTVSNLLHSGFGELRLIRCMKPITGRARQGHTRALQKADDVNGS